jgi:hypothetical protein
MTPRSSKENNPFCMRRLVKRRDDRLPSDISIGDLQVRAALWALW